MITIKQDSELMRNYVVAEPVPAGDRFAVFKDSNDEPAVLSLGEDKVLNLVMVVNDLATLIDFGEVSTIAERGKIQAFAVQQAPDGTLDICIATEASTDKSDFWLLHGLEPLDLLKPIPEAQTIRGSFPTVAHFFMSTRYIDQERDLPGIMVSFKNPDRITSTEDLKYVVYDQGKAFLSDSWELATNPKDILDVAVVTTRSGNGVVVLYAGFDDTPHLQTKFFSGNLQDMVCTPHCPPGATCLTSYQDPTSGQTVLLVGGKNVVAFKAKEYESPKGTGAVVDTKDNIGVLKNIEASYSGDALRIWYTTDLDAVHYYTTTTSALSEGVLTPLLADGRGGRVSSMLSLRPRRGKSDVPVSSLISVDEDSNLSLLQQDTASKIWQTYPFWHAGTKNVMEVNSFTLRMSAIFTKDEGRTENDTAALIPGCWLRVSSSGLVRCVVNGRHATLSPTPQWHQADARGVLNIVLQTQDATCHRFAADMFRSARGTGERQLDQSVLDPSQKVARKLDGVKTPDQLRAMKKADGSPLFSSSATDSDLKAGAESIEILVDQIHRFHEPQSMMSAAGFTEQATVFGFIDDIVDGAEDLWNWIEEKIEDIVDWGVDLVEDVSGKIYKFIVHIGETIYEIALTTISSIVKGITWVFKKLGAILQDIIDFLGFLFHWGDILDTTVSIATCFNVALDYGQETLENAESDVNGWLENLRTKVKEQLPTLKNHDYSETHSAAIGNVTASQIQSTDRKSEDDEDDTKSSVTYNWTAYQFTYGGGTTNSYLDEGTDKDSAEDSVLQIWDDVEKELSTITKTATNLVKDFVDFLGSGDYDVKALVNKVATDAIDGMIDALKLLVDILFKAVSAGISMMRSAANKDFDIPVLGWLWKRVITEGRDDLPMNLLNICALILAVPTTVLYKVKKKIPPPKLADRVTKSTFDAYTSGNGDKDLASDISAFNLAAASSIELVAGEFDTIGLLADGTFEGLGLESIPVGFIDELMGVVDSAGLTFECVESFVSWPVHDAATQSEMAMLAAKRGFDLEKFCKYSKFGLKVGNKAALVVVKAVAKAKKASRPTLKRWRGTVDAVQSIPALCIALTKDINDAVEADEQTDLIVSHFLQALFAFGKSWGNAAACWNNEIENELMYAGLAVKQVCTIAGYGLKVADFAETHI